MGGVQTVHAVSLMPLDVHLVEKGKSDEARARHYRDCQSRADACVLSGGAQIEPQIYRGNYVAFALEAGTLALWRQSECAVCGLGALRGAANDRVLIELEVADVAQEYARLKGLEVEWVHELTTQPWGHRAFYAGSGWERPQLSYGRGGAALLSAEERLTRPPAYGWVRVLRHDSAVRVTASGTITLTPLGSHAHCGGLTLKASDTKEIAP